MQPYYEHNGITIYCADWHACESVLQPKYDLLLTDPPYGIGWSRHANRAGNGVKSHQSGYLAGKALKPRDYGDSTWDDKRPSDAEMVCILSLGKEAIIWGGNYFNLGPCKGPLVWDKLRGDTDFADGEMAWHTLDRALRIFRYRWNGFLVDKDSRDVRVHPTQKPIALMKWCLGFVSDAKTVIDPFMGSGTTLEACKALGIAATGIEIEERYCEIAAKRLSQEVFDFEGVR
jgi:DNA modification methylase